MWLMGNRRTDPKRPLLSVDVRFLLSRMVRRAIPARGRAAEAAAADGISV